MRTTKTMTTTARGQYLHDRSTRGKPLSAEEQTELQAWYDEMDEAESKILNAARKDVDLTALHAQVDAANQQLLAEVKRLQEITLENNRLLAENNALQEQLLRKLST
jgi:small-conductance mechanosensitive channel